MERVRRFTMGIALLAAIAAASVGCASTGGTSLDPEEIDGPSFTLQVANDNFHDARVQIFWDGQQQRNLGRIRGSTSETYVLPYHGNRIRLRVEFVGGGGRYDSQPMTINPDQVVQYRIEP